MLELNDGCIFPRFSQKRKRPACTSKFLSLPLEVICEILLHLGPRDLLRCIWTCTALRSVALDCVELELEIEKMAFHCSSIVPDAEHTSSDCLERLRQREAAWLRLAPEGRATFNHDFPVASDHLGGGNVLTTLRAADTATGDTFRRHTELQLLSGPRHAVKNHLMFEDLDFRRVVAFKVDVSQDLLVMLVHVGEDGAHWTKEEDFEMRMLSTRDGRKHSLAAHESVVLGRLGRYTIPWDFEDGPHGDYIIHIRGPLILIYGRDVDLVREGNMIYVFNWQTGASTKMEVALGAHHVFDAVFVADNAILVLQVIEEGFKFFSIDDMSLEGEAPLRERALFCLPDLKDEYRYAHSIFATRPVMGSSGDGVVLVMVKLVNFENAGPMVSSFDLVIQIPPLLRTAFGHDDPTTTLLIPWSVWGPYYARFFDAHICDSVTMSISGYRTARSIPIFSVEDSMHGATCVHMYDFNPMMTRRALDMCTDCDNDGSSSDLASESRVSLRSLFDSGDGDDDNEDDDSTGHDDSEEEEEEEDIRPRTRSYPRSSLFPLVGSSKTRIVTSPFLKTPEDSPFSQTVYCPMPYRVVSRTYKELFTWVQLEDDALITKV
ncbi:unnamed protein product [Peniophora sp. CBMAI 1063]|nr:unnamed protein product [Peniophora sp. CBMAI 1063]